MRALAEHDIAPIDMVVVNLYRFEEAAAQPGARREELIENIDIGGPTMIRAAAKNYQDVAVVVSPADYAAIAGGTARERRRALARNQVAAGAEGLPHHRRLRRRHQRAPGDRRGWRSRPAARRTRTCAPPKLHGPALRREPAPGGRALRPRRGAGIAGAAQLHGKELSYNNLVDLDAAWQLAWEFDRPAAAIIKHTNPCGCAEQDTLAEAYRKAFECDPVRPTAA